MSAMVAKMVVTEKTYGLWNLDLAELLDLATQGLVVGVPGEATAVIGVPSQAATRRPCEAAVPQSQSCYKCHER